MNRLFAIFYAFVICMLLGSCYYPSHNQRHYSTNFNFEVSGDSIPLQVEKPMHNDLSNMYLDTVYVVHGDPLVVAQIEVIPEDSVDSVWVKVARDQMTMGWVHENELLPNVVPDDPISRFINLFSQRHFWYFIALIGMAVIGILVRRMHRQRFPMVHFDDIPTCFPTLLCLVLSGSAIIYASIQRHVPETWVHFYYHPTLNPFGLPLILGLFVLSIWLMLLLFIATIDEVRRQLQFSEAVFYVLSLCAVLMLEYLFFSLAAVLYLGYPIYAVYAVWALCRYWKRYRPHYMCGHCRAKMHALGRCPKCGTYNS